MCYRSVAKEQQLTLGGSRSSSYWSLWKSCVGANLKGALHRGTQWIFLSALFSLVCRNRRLRFLRGLNYPPLRGFWKLFAIQSLGQASQPARPPVYLLQWMQKKPGKSKGKAGERTRETAVSVFYLASVFSLSDFFSIQGDLLPRIISWDWLVFLAWNIENIKATQDTIHHTQVLLLYTCGVLVTSISPRVPTT